MSDEILLTEELAAESSNRCYTFKKMIFRELSVKFNIAQLEPIPMIPISGLVLRSKTNKQAVAVLRIAKKSIRLFRIIGNSSTEYDEIVALIDKYASVFEFYAKKSISENGCTVWMAEKIKRNRVSGGHRHNEIVPGTILVARIEESGSILYGSQWFMQVIHRTDAKMTVRAIRSKPASTSSVNGIFFEYLPVPNVFDDAVDYKVMLPLDSSVDSDWFASLKSGVSLRTWDGNPILASTVII